MTTRLRGRTSCGTLLDALPTSSGRPAVAGDPAAAEADLGFDALRAFLAGGLSLRARGVQP